MNAGALQGTLHILVAFDWGEEINLDQARKLVPASTHALARRRRTPPSFFFRPAPLHLTLEPVPLELAEVGTISAQAGLTVFDFAAVSLALRVPFALAPDGLGRLAGVLADPSRLVQAARATLEPIYTQILPAIQGASWLEDLSEDYFVFQLPPEVLHNGAAGPPPWLAGLVHLESGPLSTDEIAEALRLRITYSPDDLFIPDWAAAVLIDQDCEETLQAIEFANLQLLEFRFIDNRLDDRLAAAARFIHPLTRRGLPFWRLQSRPLRVLGELKVDAENLFERTGNVLKLVGDPYLARVYRLVASRFHLDTWEENIQRKLEVAEGVYQVVSDQASGFRMELLEVIVVLLILFEVVTAFFRH